MRSNLYVKPSVGIGKGGEKADVGVFMMFDHFILESVNICVYISCRYGRLL